ncbi:MAG: phosphotransferase [Pseudomonadota bacterium]
MTILSDSRAEAIDAFLDKAGFGSARRIPLGQDASTRSYVRLVGGPKPALLMDAPPVEDAPCPPDASEATRISMGWNASTRLAASRVNAFAAIARHLRSRGFSAPEVLAEQSDVGLAIIEDFGEGHEFARLIERGEADEVDLYTKAAEALADWHSESAPERLENWPILDFDALALRAGADLFAEWLPQLETEMRLDGVALQRWEIERDALIEQAVSFTRSFILRDYHAENLLWLPERAGKARIGLLDFQDAVNGWDAWDMAMLVQDARREVSERAETAARHAYLDVSGKDEVDFLERLAVIGTLNALRITGLFARLPVRDGKQRYLDFMPRQQALLVRNLKHPACADMAGFVRDVAPFLFERHG